MLYLFLNLFNCLYYYLVDLLVTKYWIVYFFNSIPQVQSIGLNSLLFTLHFKRYIFEFVGFKYPCILSDYDVLNLHFI